jgi:hypothetical protein
MKLVAEFAEACENKTQEEIYELFEDDISQELRDRIYSFSEVDTPEPVRSALNGVGILYNVQSLLDY